MNKQLLRALCKACITISYNLSMLRCCMIISGVWLHHLKDLIVCNCFFFSATHYFILFVSLLRPHRRLFLQRGLFSHVLRQIIFRARIMFLQRLILGFVWTHVMQCKHRFTPGIDGTSATFAASPNLPSHFPRVRRVTFFYPSAAFRTFLGGCLVSATSVQKAIVMSTDCCKASNLFCMFVQSWWTLCGHTQNAVRVHVL